MVKRVLIAAILLLFTATSALAIGGGRSGFTLGASLGYAPVLAWDRTVDGNGGPATGPVTSIMIGYGIDDRNTLVFEGTTARPNGKHKPVMNFTGIRWYAFDRPAAPAAFFTCGIGWCSLTSSSDAAVFNFIVGGGANLPSATLGLGYELADRQIIGLYINAGRQSNFTLINVSILFTIMGY